MLSKVAVEPSAFWASGLDIMVWQLPAEGRDFYFFISGDDIRYLSGIAVDKEQTVIGQTQLKKDYGNGWQTEAELLYLYQNQVFDASIDETNLRTVQAKGHRFALNPSVRRAFGPAYRGELELGVIRQFLKYPLDDYWEVGPRFVLGRAYGYQSDLALSYEFFHRPYEERFQTLADGTPLPDRPLAYQQHETALAWQHYWDKQRCWRTTTKLSLVLNQDNGSGYFDYRKYQASQQVRYRTKKWEARVQGKVSFYDYPIQTISDTDLSLRQKTLLVVNVRGERRLTRSLKWYAEFEHERALSNIALDEYRVNLVSSGLDWEF
jgi:hypothetical protein